MALESERKELSKLRDENELLKRRLEMIDQEKNSMADREKQLMDKIQGLSENLAFYSRNVADSEKLKQIETLREEKAAQERQILQ